MKRFTLIFLFFSCRVFAQDSIPVLSYFTSTVLGFDSPSDTQRVFFDTTQSNNIWQIGQSTKLYLSSTSNTPIIITDTINGYPFQNQSSFSIKVFTNGGHPLGLWVWFYHAYQTDTLQDGGMIEISHDGGQTWTNVINDPNYWGTGDMYTASDTIASLNNQSGFSGGSFGGIGNWGYSSFEIGCGLCGPRIIDFRFTFASDSSNIGKDGWAIDYIEFQNLLESVEEYNSKFIQLFPNPSNGMFYFQSIGPLSQVNFNTLEVMSLEGRKIIVQKNVSNEIDLSTLQDGFYFLQLLSNAGTFTKKIQIIR